MDDQKAKKAFSLIKFDIKKLESQLERIEKKVSARPQKDQEIDQIFKILQSLKVESDENTKRIEALNLGEKLVEDSSVNLSKEVEELKEKINSIKSVPASSTKSVSSSDANIEDALNEFSELINEKVQIEINSLRLEFTEEIAKLYDKCFNEIISVKAEVNKKAQVKQVKEKKESVKETKKVQKSFPFEKTDKKESKLKKISKFLFVDEDDLASIKKEVKK